MFKYIEYKLIILFNFNKYLKKILIYNDILDVYIFYQLHLLYTPSILYNNLI